MSFVDVAFTGVIPTFINDTFPVVCGIVSFCAVVSTDKEVPGYGGGGGNLSEIKTYFSGTWF